MFHLLLHAERQGPWRLVGTHICKHGQVSSGQRSSVTSSIKQHGKQKYDLHIVDRTEKVDLGGGRREEVEAAEATGNDRKVYVEEFPEVSDTSTDITRKLRKTKCSGGDARSPKDEGKWSEKWMSYCKRTYEHVKGENSGDRRSEGERQTRTQRKT